VSIIPKLSGPPLSESRPDHCVPTLCLRASVVSWENNEPQRHRGTEQEKNIQKLSKVNCNARLRRVRWTDC